MADSLLGKLCDDDAKRDAMHVAVIPVYCGETVVPGQRIFVAYSGINAYCGERFAERFNAVVDPFLKEPVKPYQTFYACMDPNTITNLRHNWSHPDIEDDNAAEEDYVDGCRNC